MNKASTIDYLSMHGIKPSLQRIAVMDYLLANRTHPTADEIYSALSPAMPTLSKTTVYNTLRLFVERGAAIQLCIAGRVVCFDADTQLHAHFFCRRCGCIIDFPAPPEAQNAPAMPAGCLLENTEVVYRGLCAACANDEALQSASEGCDCKNTNE